MGRGGEYFTRKGQEMVIVHKGEPLSIPQTPQHGENRSQVRDRRTGEGNGPLEEISPSGQFSGGGIGKKKINLVKTFGPGVTFWGEP